MGFPGAFAFENGVQPEMASPLRPWLQARLIEPKPYHKAEIGTQIINYIWWIIEPLVYSAVVWGEHRLSRLERLVRSGTQKAKTSMLNHPSYVSHFSYQIGLSFQSPLLARVWNSVSETLNSSKQAEGGIGKNIFAKRMMIKQKRPDRIICRGT